jgi:hypothetical protein
MTVCFRAMTQEMFVADDKGVHWRILKMIEEEYSFLNAVILLYSEKIMDYVRF